MATRACTIGSSIAIIVTCLAAAACNRSDADSVAPLPVVTPSTPSTPSTSAAATTRAVELPRFVNLVREQGATVVNISAIGASSAGGLPPGHPLHEFFRRFGEAPEAGADGRASVGSGFIISADGYILTSAHVISATDTVRVKLTSKRVYRAKVIGVDPFTDVALIKIEATGLRPVRTGDPASMEPGEWVAAIGAPFGFENSVTVGVVSAKGRQLPNGSYVPFIQTDVAVNPGNSGGPLFDTAGNVIGINSQIYSQTGGWMGISFAIPIDIAMEIAQQLRAHGKVTRGRIGVHLQELTYDAATALDLKEPRGALVAAVQRDGPAYRAGIRAEDVILAFNGKEVITSADLARFIGSAKPGIKVLAQVWRGGQKSTVRVEVETLR